MHGKKKIGAALLVLVAVLAVTAGAYGAEKYVITSSSQIKDGAVGANDLSAGAKDSLQGDRGPRGAKGADGSAGANGPAGPQGPVGAAGPKGAQGNEGGQGPAGAASTVAGPAGPVGPIGATGPAGPQGTSAPGVVVTHSTSDDSNVCGGNWAHDDYQRTLQFVPADDGTIHVVRWYDGTFTTTAGDAPAGPCGSGDLAAGITGTLTGYDVVVVTGGTFTPGATCPDPCTTQAMVDAFFPGGSTAVNDGWEYKYDTASNGHWINRSAARGGNSGNIG